MPDQIAAQFATSPANPVYAIIRNTAGLVWNGSAFSTYSTANYATYPIALVQQGTASRYFTATFPATITTPGLYAIVVFQQAVSTGATYSEASDAEMGAYSIDWTGTAITTLASRSTFDPNASGVNVTKILGTAAAGDPYAYLFGNLPQVYQAVLATNESATNIISALPANFASLGISSAGKITGVVLTDTLTTYTGNTPQTGDAFTIVANGSYGNAALGTGIATVSTQANKIGTNAADSPNAASAQATIGTNLNATVSSRGTYSGGNITGNLSGSVGSVTSGVTVAANNDKTAYTLSASTGWGGSPLPNDYALQSTLTSGVALSAGAIAASANAVADRITFDHGTGSYVDTGSGGGGSSSQPKVVILRTLATP